jgi:CcmD family protein
MKRRLCVACSTVLLTLALAAASTAAAQQPPSPPGQSEFVPAKDLPVTESIPAAPLLIAGYSIVWVAVAFYVWTIWRRLNKVEAEMRALARKTPQR